MNCAKYTRNQASNILVHCNRSDPNRTYGNQEIHHERTYLNYNLAPNHSGMTDFEFMKKRCEELKIFRRNDVNWMVSWVITMPSDYTGDQKKFFEESYNFMANKYGTENIISAYVHLDETSPHIHFCFVPVVFDDKKQAEKVNAKKLISKTELKKIHPEMKAYLESKLQTKVNILNGATKEGNKSIEELKKEEVIKQKAIRELIENPTEEIKASVLDKMPMNQIDNIISIEESRIAQQLREDENFINECKQTVANEINDRKDEQQKIEEKIEELQGKKDSISQSILELEIQHAEQKKRLKEEYERERQRNNARIAEMQNTTIEQEKEKPSFWNKIADKIFNFKLVATVSFVKYQLSNDVPLDRILKNVKKFRKNFDKYVDNPELVKQELKNMDFMDIGLERIEKSEQEDIAKKQERDDYDIEI